MNRTFAVLILLILFTDAAVSLAQCPSDKYQWDFSLSYGLMTSSIYNDNNAPDGNKTITQVPHTTFFTVRYFLYNRLALGGAAGVASEKGTISATASPSSISGTYSVSNTTVALELYYIYFFRKYLEVYTFAGLGPAFSAIETTASTPSSGYTSTTSSLEAVKAQYTPIAVRVGGRLAGYAELGYGYKGVFNFGLSYKLGPSCWWKDDFR